MINKETLDLLLLVTQILTLIALVIYVAKTWQIASATKVAAGISALTLEELKATRDHETAPYVVVYFDVPQGQHVINLVIKNIGRSTAQNVRLTFSPDIIGISDGNISDLPVIKNGIPSLPPNYELKTFVDTTMTFFGDKAERPLAYNVKISFIGGIKESVRTSEQILDLTPYKGLSWISRKGLHELSNEVEKIARSVDRISREFSDLNNSLSEGIHLRNSVLTSVVLRSDNESWRWMVISKLLEFKYLWVSCYGGDVDKLLQPFLGKFKNRLNQLADQLLVITASCPNGIDDSIKKSLLSIVAKLSELDSLRFYLDGGRSAAGFDARGNDVLKLVDETINSLQGIPSGAGG